MKFNKIISKLLALLLLFNSFAYGQNNWDADIEPYVGEELDINGYTVTVLEDTQYYQKINILDNETREIETLEAFKKGNDWEYISKANGNTLYMEKLNNHLTIFDENKTMIKSIDLSNDFIEINDSQSSIKPLSTWGEAVYFERSTDIAVAVVGLAIAIVAAKAGVSVNNSIAISVGTFFFSLALPTAYYAGYYQNKWEDGMYHTRKYTSFYENNSYHSQYKIGETIYSYGFH